MSNPRAARDDAKVASNADGEPLVVKKPITGKGYGLVASGASFHTRETVLWIRQPLTLTLETSKLQERCYQCLRTQTSDDEDQQRYSREAPTMLKSCVGCHTVKYCGKKCQSRSWKEHHKHECKVYGVLSPRILPSPVRAILRLLKLRSNGQLDDQDWKDLLSLQSHQDDLSTIGGEQWQDVFLMAKAAQKYSGTKEPMEIIIRICCILTVNSFTLTDEVLEPLGMVLDPMAALLNHSCDPNCIIRFDARPLDDSPRIASNAEPVLGSISIDLLRPVKDGEELTISYIDNTFPLSKRKSDLSSRYFFTCNCSRCSQLTQTTFDKLLTRSIPAAASEVETHAIQVLDAATSKPATLVSMLPTIRAALSRLAQTSTFPVHRYPYAALRLQLVLALIASSQWREATLQSGVIVYCIDPLLYSQPHHPIRVVNKFRLYRLARHMCLETSKNQIMAEVNEDEEMMLKMTVVVTIMELEFERPKSAVRAPASALDIMLHEEKTETMRADLQSQGKLEGYARPDLFEGPLEAYRIAPEQVKESLEEKWQQVSEKVLSGERVHHASVEQV